MTPGTRGRNRHEGSEFTLGTRVTHGHHSHYGSKKQWPPIGRLLFVCVLRVDRGFERRYKQLRRCSRQPRLGNQGSPLWGLASITFGQSGILDISTDSLCISRVPLWLACKNRRLETTLGKPTLLLFQ